MSIHKEHRQRIRSRYEDFGLETFQAHEVLELLLFYSIAQKDTNALAHRLIDRFGSLEKVFNAPCKELEKVEGVGHGTAVYLRLMKDVWRYCELRRASKNEPLASLDDCGKYVMPILRECKVEKTLMLCLDAKCGVLCCREVSEGSVNATMISIRKIIEIALNENATSVVLVHNHPSGLAFPSAADIQTTMRIDQALASVDVYLADHLIVSDDEMISMVQSGCFSPRITYRSMMEVPR